MDRITENMHEDRNFKLFNSPLEIGLRTLYVLNEFVDRPVSIDKMIYYDYFLVHSGDVAKTIYWNNRFPK